MKTRIEELDSLWARLRTHQIRDEDRPLLAELVGKEIVRLKKLVAVNQASKQKRIRLAIAAGALVQR